ncbi:hypothetical protein [Streptomyces sp. NPDC055036]
MDDYEIRHLEPDAVALSNGRDYPLFVVWDLRADKRVPFGNYRRRDQAVTRIIRNAAPPQGRRVTAIHLIDDANAHAIGDSNRTGEADMLCIRPAATSRRDSPRFWEAVGVALVRGRSAAADASEVTA